MMKSHSKNNDVYKTIVSSDNYKLIFNGLCESAYVYLAAKLSVLKPESPIEGIAILVLLAELKENKDVLCRSHEIATLTGKHNKDFNDRISYSDVFLDTQYEIGKYRADILLTFTTDHYTHEFGEQRPVYKLERITHDVIIECDGHDFHEKTKEQVKKRNERDRYLIKEGYQIFHISGSELYNNPYRAIIEVIDASLTSIGNTNKNSLYKSSYYSDHRIEWEELFCDE